MNKAVLLVGLFLALSSLDLVRGQTALASYFCESAVPASPIVRKSCGTCNRLFISRATGTDGRLTSFVYSYCFSDGSISLEVGFGKTQKSTLILYGCEDGQLFKALDPTQRTLAAEFFISCTDTMIYKCPKNQLFNADSGKCVQQTYPLVSQLPCTGTPCSSPTQVSVSTELCDSKVSEALKPKCTSCTTPFVEQPITETVEGVPRFYTFCPKTGRFSLDIGVDTKTYFRPKCSGTNPLVPLVSSKKYAKSKFFWDCRIGLISCNPDRAFDPASNKCVVNTNVDNQYTCTKRCSSSYGPYQSGQPVYYQPY